MTRTAAALVVCLLASSTSAHAARRVVAAPARTQVAGVAFELSTLDKAATWNVRIEVPDVEPLVSGEVTDPALLVEPGGLWVGLSWGAYMPEREDIAETSGRADANAMRLTCSADGMLRWFDLELAASDAKPGITEFECPHGNSGLRSIIRVEVVLVTPVLAL